MPAFTKPAARASVDASARIRPRRGRADRRPARSRSPSGCAAAPSSRGRRDGRRCRAESREDLHLDVARSLDQLLDEERPVAERGGRFARTAGERLGELASADTTTADATATAAGGGLEHHRVAERARPRRRPRRRPGDRPVAAGARWGSRATVANARARTLSPNSSSTSGGGPTKVRPATAQAEANVGVLREEAVAGVDAVAAGCRPRPARGVDVEVRSDRRRPALRSARPRWPGGCAATPVDVGVHRDRRHPERVGRPGDADRDLTTVGDQHSM